MAKTTLFASLFSQPSQAGLIFIFAFFDVIILIPNTCYPDFPPPPEIRRNFCPHPPLLRVAKRHHGGFFSMTPAKKFVLELDPSLFGAPPLFLRYRTFPLIPVSLRKRLIPPFPSNFFFDCRLETRSLLALFYRVYGFLGMA